MVRAQNPAISVGCLNRIRIAYTHIGNIFLFPVLDALIATKENVRLMGIFKYFQKKSL
jgi:hypothetical protein